MDQESVEKIESTGKFSMGRFIVEDLSRSQKGVSIERIFVENVSRSVELEEKRFFFFRK